MTSLDMNTIGNERTPEEWGRVAVSLPGWRWMRGMSIAATANNREALVDYPPSLIYVSDGGTDEREYVEDIDYPDPDDPATAGCLLELLGAEAWMLMFVRWPGDGHRDGECAWQTSATPPTTLGRACIAAAEALGRWPGGQA